MKPFILGIAGGTGSGKTTIANAVAKHFGKRCIVIPHDRYYKDQSNKSITQREQTNYDHPDSLETNLLIKDLKQLITGESVNIPEYDFTQHTRKPLVTIKVKPAPLIIIEGILIYQNAALRSTIDLKVFVDVPADIRILRRTKRDIEERGRTLEFCIKQYTTLTKPMHDKYIEPSKTYADHIVTQGGHNKKAIAALINDVETQLK